MVIVKVKKKEYPINDISFSEKRKLHMLNSLCFSKAEINQTKYYEMLEFVRDLAGYGNGTENEAKLSELSMVEVDTVLQTFLMEYLGLNKAKK
tara:strand:+ start:59 stop:337 length:279 start_codon:yes stop_codon:yes gene_type:complete